jgi:hypothetical protein
MPALLYGVRICRLQRTCRHHNITSAWDPRRHWLVPPASRRCVADVLRVQRVLRTTYPVAHSVEHSRGGFAETPVAPPHEGVDQPHNSPSWCTCMPCKKQIVTDQISPLEGKASKDLGPVEISNCRYTLCQSAHQAIPKTLLYCCRFQMPPTDARLLRWQHVCNASTIAATLGCKDRSCNYINNCCNCISHTPSLVATL